MIVTALLLLRVSADKQHQVTDSPEGTSASAELPTRTEVFANSATRGQSRYFLLRFTELSYF